MWFGILNTCDLKPNGLNVIKKTDEVMNENFVKEVFQLPGTKLDIKNRGRDKKRKRGGRESIRVGVIVLLSE